MNNKKIAVLGTGANGSCVAADLTNAGLDVVLIDQWPEHVEAIAPLDANALRTEAREDLGAPRTGEQPCEVQDAHAFEGQAPAAAILVARRGLDGPCLRHLRRLRGGSRAGLRFAPDRLVVSHAG